MDPDDTSLHNGSYVIQIDNNNDEADREFIVKHDGGNNPIFRVAENGDIHIYGPIKRGAAIVLDRVVGAGDILRIATAGTTMAKIDDNGTGYFDQGAIVLPVETADPNGGLAGHAAGEVRIYYKSGPPAQWFLCVCTAAASTVWKEVELL